MTPDPSDLITLQQASKILPTRPHAATVYRWAIHGVRGVRLKVWRFGRQHLTTRAALLDFAEALADAPPVETKHRRKSPRNRRDRAASLAAAEQELAARGA